MPEVGDFIQYTIVTELEGVAMRNTIYWQIDNLGNTDNLSDIARILGVEWINESEGILSVNVEYIAFLVDNLTRNEIRGVHTTTQKGTILRDAHPQDQVLRFNEWAPANEGEAVFRGGFNLSGLEENLSTDGRVNDIPSMEAIERYLMNQFIDSDSGLNVSPHVRRRTPGSSPPVYTFHKINKAQVNPTLFKLKSRKTTVLGF